MSRRFGDFFTYKVSTDLIGGRRFYECTLLKDMYTKNAGESFGVIYIDSPRYISFGDEFKSYRFKREISLKIIQNEVFNEILKNVHMGCFEMWSGIEDKHGVILNLRESMFVEQYMSVLKYEFERSVNKIKRYWKRSISDPNYEMCRRRLMTEFMQLS
jgi:hypothetical protein